MKHNLQITLILIAMFIVTQIIGLIVVNAYLPVQTQVLNQTSGQYENITISTQLPYGTNPPEMTPEVSLINIVVAIIIAIVLIFILMKIKATLFLRFWFFAVVALAMGITLNPLFRFSIYSSLISIIIALPLAFFKIYKRNIIVHNLTELLIYPGIAAIFVLIFNLWTIIIFLVLISVYDIWAVWHSGIMQKMAKFQMNELKLFGGFFIPYLSSKQRQEIKMIREKYKEKADKKLKKKKIRVALAILGGGDVVFPIIAAGVFLKMYGLIPALIVSLFATIALLALFIFARKGKFYPAMPFLTTGIFIGMILGYLI